MIRATRCWWIPLVWMAVGACERRNFDTMCQLAKDILAEPRVEPAQRLDRFKKQLGHLAAGSARTAAEAALAAAPGERVAAFMAVAEDAAPGWSCAALEPVLEPAASGDTSPNAAP